MDAVLGVDGLHFGQGEETGFELFTQRPSKAATILLY